MPFSLNYVAVSPLQLAFALKKCKITRGRLLLVGDKMPVASFIPKFGRFITQSKIIIDIGVQRHYNSNDLKVTKKKLI